MRFANISGHTTRQEATEMNSRPDPRQLADRHANEAERLLGRRFGFFDDTLEAQAHATP